MQGLNMQYAELPAKVFVFIWSSGGSSPRCGRRRWPESPTTVFISLTQRLATPSGSCRTVRIFCTADGSVGFSA